MCSEIMLCVCVAGYIIGRAAGSCNKGFGPVLKGQYCLTCVQKLCCVFVLQATLLAELQARVTRALGQC